MRLGISYPVDGTVLTSTLPLRRCIAPPAHVNSNQLSITHPSFRPAGAVRANTSDEANADTDAEADADLGTQRFFYDALTSPEHPPTCLDFFDLIQRRLERDGMALKKVTHVTPGENGFAAFELVVGTL